jgi:hypothetical protein
MKEMIEIGDLLNTAPDFGKAPDFPAKTSP